MKKSAALLLTILLMVLVLFTGLAEESAADRKITFEEPDYVVYVGKQLKINATVEAVLESAPKQTQLVWNTSDPDVAMVNAGGQVTGKKAGKVSITAAAKDNEAVTATAEVEVRVPVQSVQINEKNVTVVTGGKE